jgi:surfeit locus 1 family protein
MRRIPILPTLFVAAAIAVMIGLGVWQLQRSAWKTALIRNLEASSATRRMTFACTIDAKPEVRAGRNMAQATGYRYLVPCRRSTSDGDQVEFVEGKLDIGWSTRPNLLPHVRQSGVFTGSYEAGEAGRNQILVLEKPVPPLERSALPKAADLPNNHMAYALQWFFFAAAAAVIYVLALRRRRRTS